MPTPLTAEFARAAVMHHIRASQRTQAPPPTLRVPVTASLDPLGQTKGCFFRPCDDVRRPRGYRAQAGRAGVFLCRTGQAAHLIIAAVGAAFRTLHGGEAVHLQRTRLAPRSFLATFTSHATTVPRRQTRRTASSESTSTMSAFFPAASEPIVSSPRMVAP